MQITKTERCLPNSVHKYKGQAQGLPLQGKIRVRFIYTTASVWRLAKRFGILAV
jgi:hypothetical protein